MTVQAQLRRFLLKLTLFLGSLVLMAGLVCTGADILCQDDYMAASRDKEAWLAQAGSPKVVFVGGSNLVFQLDTPAVEKKVGKPVVNMGLQAGLGLSFCLHEVEAQIHAGDTVVITCEFGHFQGNFRGDPATLLEAVVENPRTITFMTPFQQRSLISGIPGLLRKKGLTMLKGAWRRGRPVGIYRRSAFGPRGDLKLEQAPPAAYTMSVAVRRELFDYEAVDALAQFVAAQEARGVHVVFFVGSLESEFYEKNRDGIEFVLAQVRTRLGARVLGNYQNYVLDRSFYYDGSWHTNASGRAQRMRLVERDLVPVLRRLQ